MNRRPSRHSSPRMLTRIIGGVECRPQSHAMEGEDPIAHTRTAFSLLFSCIKCNRLHRKLSLKHSHYSSFQINRKGLAQLSSVYSFARVRPILTPLITAIV